MGVSKALKFRTYRRLWDKQQYDFDIEVVEGILILTVRFVKWCTMREIKASDLIAPLDHFTLQKKLMFGCLLIMFVRT